MVHDDRVGVLLPQRADHVLQKEEQRVVRAATGLAVAGQVDRHLKEGRDDRRRRRISPDEANDWSKKSECAEPSVSCHVTSNVE